MVSDVRIAQAKLLAGASSCALRKSAVLIVDTRRGNVLMDGVQGPADEAGSLCGGAVCLRLAQGLTEGSHEEIGCHLAEMNAVCNAAAAGVALRGTHAIVVGAPTPLGAKLLHHAGVEKVSIVARKDGFEEGVTYLRRHGIAVNLLRVIS